MSTHMEEWKNVDVYYNIETGVLDIRDRQDSEKQLGLFYVIDRD